MRGNNKLYLNQSSMIEVLQLWVDANFKEPPKVTSVDYDANDMLSKYSFVVTFGEHNEPT